ncbi:hypothetical protein [Luteimonas sp. FCS-9]|uniref:hypothetical protein n=1 Tax=Luteimonas sp. FCS-9 TaxID=1547516 RepID=UPI00069BCD5D|nr:hypothetical protein [Luteimonas sp. FCS-9]
MDAFAECLGRIRRADGYHTDAGAWVTTEAGMVPDSQGIVIGLVVGKQERATDRAVVRTHRLTSVGVILKLHADIDDAIEQQDRILSDLDRALDPTQKFRFPRGYQFPEFQTMEPAPVQQGAGWTGVVVVYSSHIPIHPAAG